MLVEGVKPREFQAEFRMIDENCRWVPFIYELVVPTNPILLLMVWNVT